MSDELIPRRLSAIESAISTINAAIEDLGSRITQFSLNPFTSNNPITVASQTIATRHMKNLSVTTAKIDNLAVTNAKVSNLDAGKITTGSLITTLLNIALIIVAGATWTDNSPGAGSVAWSGATVYYQGTAYTITNSNTALKYIWWSSTSSNTTFQSSDTRPTLTDVEFMVATNISGAHDLVWNASANSGVFPTHLSFDAFAQLFIYGDGVDGDVTISADTDLTRDMMYNNLTINSAKVLRPMGYRIFVKNTFTNNGTLRRNGVAGTTGTVGFLSPGNGGAGLVDGTMGGSSSGGSGAAGAGSSGNALQSGIGAVGGTGGNGLFAGGLGGALTTIYANRHGLVLLSTSPEVRGASGGGGGGGSNTGAGASGGGGGSGGGAIVISAKTLTNSGVIESKGGDGGTGYQGGTGLAGGGGGGGGGALVLIYRTITQGTLTVTGGAGGAGGGGGNAGNAGSTGLTLLIQQEA